MLLSLTVAALLTQAAAQTESAADKAANAAMRAADAAEKAAEAAQRIADVVAPRAAPAPAAAPAAPAVDAWKGNFGLGLTWLSGNSSNLALAANLGLDKRWGDWALGLRAGGAFGFSNTTGVEGAEQRTAERAGITVRGDRSFGSGFAAIFALVGSEFDHVKNLQSRTVGEVGAGLTFLNLKEGDLEKLFLKLDLGLRAGYESNMTYPTALNPAVGDIPRGIGANIILGPRAALTFRWNFNKDVRISEELEFIPFLLAPKVGRLLINNNTKLSARVTENIAITASLLINYDSMPPQPALPAPQKGPFDSALAVGLEALF